MNFSTWSIRNQTASLMLFVFLTVLGIWGFQGLIVQNFPDLDLPIIRVILIEPGAAPAQLETEVARKVEDSIATLQGVKHIRTNITDGRVSITAEFTLSRVLSDALLDVKDAVDRVRNQLPTDLEEPQVSKVSIGPGGPTLTYAVSHPDMNEEALSWFVDDTLERTVLGVPGTAVFTRVGGVKREVQVTVDPVQMAGLGVTAADISRALKLVQQNTSGGRGQLGGSEQAVRTLATVKQASDLEALPVTLTDGRSLRLDQVATVADTTAERVQAALLDGKPAIGFQVFRTKDYDETKMTAAVALALTQLEQKTPGLKVTLVRNTVDTTVRQYKASMQMLIEGAILAVVVIWFFLRDWRATLLGAIALPLSIIPTFAVMHWFGYSLNTVTLLALAVVVGILVDDAVVEVENISRHLHLGKTPMQATIDAVNEIALAVIATTFTLVAVFAPLALMSGVPGMVFKQFGVSLVASVLFSLLVARMLTPMMGTWLLKAGHAEPAEGRVMRTYLRAADWCLRHHKTTMLAGIGFFVASLSLIPLLPTAFLPPEDQSAISINMELPPGASLSASLATAEEIRHAVEGVKDVKSVFTTVGNAQFVEGAAGDMAGEVNRGTVVLILPPRNERHRGQQAIEREIRPLLEQVSGARLSIGGGDRGERLQIVLSSQDVQSLKTSAQAIERQLRENVPQLSSIISSASLERAEVTIRPDPALAAERGVSTQMIGETLRIALAGDFEAALSKLNLDNRQLDIRVQVPASYRRDLDAIGNLRIPGRNGLVTLSSIASLSLESGPSQIRRLDRERQVTVTGDLGGFPIGEAVKARDALPAIKNLPPSVRLVDGEDAEVMKEMMGQFNMALLLGVTLIYTVLVLLFKSWFQPITILSALPLSIGGAFVALLATHYPLGMSSLIGILMLLGIVTKNSILLVDFAVKAQREDGLSLHDALIDSCRKRARPILMTTIAMMAGLAPLALGFGGDSEFRQPMAIAVSGGLVTSTALSLLLVPVVFIYITRFQQWLTYMRKTLQTAPAKTVASSTEPPSNEPHSSEPSANEPSSAAEGGLV